MLRSEIFAIHFPDFADRAPLDSAARSTKPFRFPFFPAVDRVVKPQFVVARPSSRSLWSRLLKLQVLYCWTVLGFAQATPSFLPLVPIGEFGMQSQVPSFLYSCSCPPLSHLYLLYISIGGPGRKGKIKRLIVMGLLSDDGILIHGLCQYCQRQHQSLGQDSSHYPCTWSYHTLL